MNMIIILCVKTKMVPERIKNKNVTVLKPLYPCVLNVHILSEKQYFGNSETFIKL